MKKTPTRILPKVSVGLLVLGIIVGVVGLTNYVGARLSYRQETIKEVARQYLEQVFQETDDPVAGFSLGSVASVNTTTDRTLLSNFPNGVNVGGGGLRHGDTNTFSSEGITYHVEVVDFTDASTTAVGWKNPFDDTIYLTNVGYVVLGKGTTTVRAAVGTSTSAFVNPTTATWLSEDAGSSAKLMRGFGNLGPASSHSTGTILWLQHYEGVYASADNFPIPMANDEYINVFATSTADTNCSIVCSDNTFDGELYIEYFTVDSGFNPVR